MRLTDSARESFFDENGNPKTVQEIKINDEETGSIKVGENMFEFSIVKEKGRCEIVEFEYVIFSTAISTYTTNHTRIVTARTRKQ